MEHRNEKNYSTLKIFQNMENLAWEKAALGPTKHTYTYIMHTFHHAHLAEPGCLHAL